MFVNTNVAAQNAWLNLDNTQNDMTKILQQLSSGLQINSAADNPSGLAIAQQMQSEITGMGQAYQNSQTGINLFQTADSALSQIQNILQSMRSLASQAATGTENSTDLQTLQSEMNQYSQEITQISNDTNFNTLNLLGGSFTNESIQVGADQGQNLSVSIGAADAYSLGVTGLAAAVSNASGQTVLTNNGLSDGDSINAAGVSALSGSWTMAGAVTPWQVSAVGGTNTADFVSLGGSGYTATGADTVTINETGASTITVTDGGTTSSTITGTADGSNYDYNVTINGGTFKLVQKAGTSGNSYTLTVAPSKTLFTVTDPNANAYTSTVNGVIANNALESVSVGGGALNFAASKTLADETDASYTTTWDGTSLTAPTAAALTSASFTVAQSGSAASSYTNGTGNGVAKTGVDITSQPDAEAALTVLSNAIDTISSQRATIGAYQNRLQFAASDLQSSEQNLSAAQAQIMDADVAQGMSTLTRDQILQQSGVAMLAQANAMPQALLKLIP